MRIIKNLKSTSLKDYYSAETLSYIFGLRVFQIGVLFLASAPVIAFMLLIISSIISSFNRSDNYFKDKYNYPLIFVSLLMIINCLIVSLNSNSYLYETSNIWIGLSNWIPFFWCFWAFQPYLKNSRLRVQISKIFIIGSFPVLLSGFFQYFLKLYGPYSFFYDLIVWYQRPLEEYSGVTGLFNNQNYAGAWLCIVLPLCLVFLISGNKNKRIKIFLFLICFSFVYMIVLTSSRIAIISIFFSIFLFAKSIKNKLIVLFSFLSVPVALNLIPIASLKIQSIIYEFLPYELIKKTSLTNIPNLNLFPRVEVWIKSIELIKSNLITGYGAGSFKSLYDLSNGTYKEMQHSHNIFLEIALNHGLLSSIIILVIMLWLIFFSWKNSLNQFDEKDTNLQNEYKIFDKSWIISFIIFFIIHNFDITYFDGRISTSAWILLAGMRSMIKESQKLKIKS